MASTLHMNLEVNQKDGFGLNTSQFLSISNGNKRHKIFNLNATEIIKSRIFKVQVW